MIKIPYLMIKSKLSLNPSLLGPKLSRASLLLLLLTLNGCQSVPNDPVTMKKGLDKAISDTAKLNAPKALTQVPDAVQQELMQHNMQQAKQGLLAEKRLQVAATSVDAKDFFTAIVDGSPYSVAIHPDVTGKITLNLTDVTLTETFDVVQQIYGYEVIKKGSIIQIYPSGIRTETIALNYLFLKRFGTSSTSINSGGVSENGTNNSGNGNNGNNSGGNSGSNNSNQNGNNQNSQNSSGINLYTENEADFWTELKETLDAFVGKEEGRSVIVSPLAGLVTVRGLPSEIDAVKKFIQDTEKHLHRQVIIEAKIMEVTLNDDYQQGVHWDEVLGSLGDTNFTFSTSGSIAGNVISSSIGGTSSLSFSGPDFSGVISLLQTQGNVQVLSSPRITATNNQKAVIKVGEDEYFVTEVSSTTTTGTATTTTPEVTLTDEQNKTIQLGSEELILPLAQSSVRESDTIIRAKSGEIVVIGGLIESYTIDLESKTPLLGDIPFLGELFKSKSETTQKRELVILLKPIVVGQDTWKTQLQDARSLLKTWYPEETDETCLNEQAGNCS